MLHLHVKRPYFDLYPTCECHHLSKQILYPRFDNYLFSQVQIANINRDQYPVLHGIYHCILHSNQSLQYTT